MSALAPFLIYLGLFLAAMLALGLLRQWVSFKYTRLPDAETWRIGMGIRTEALEPAVAKWLRTRTKNVVHSDKSKHAAHQIERYILIEDERALIRATAPREQPILTLGYVDLHQDALQFRVGATHSIIYLLRLALSAFFVPILLTPLYLFFDFMRDNFGLFANVCAVLYLIVGILSGVRAYQREVKEIKAFLNDESNSRSAR